jgi:regulator of RNase E activity RraA
MVPEAALIPPKSTGTSSPEESFREPQPSGKTRPRSAEIHPGPGFQIRRNIERPDPRKLEHLRDFGTPDVSDQLNRLYTLSPCIKNQVNDLTIAGPALTVLVYPGDNLMVHKALDLARPGDVIVVNSAFSTNGVIGDLVATKARHRGIAGFVIDGYIRDIEGIREAGVPVFARGITPFGPLHRGPGEINFPISCSGVVVNPGDAVLADANGVVIVRREMLDDMLVRLEQHAAALKDYTRAVRRGEFSNEWVDRQLDAGGCAFVD